MDYTPPGQRYHSWSRTPDDYHRTSTSDSPVPVVPELDNQEQSLLTNPFPATDLFRVTTPNNISQNKAEIRQTEIRRRMREVQLEMADLERDAGASHMHLEPNTNVDLRVTMEHMRREIEGLKEVQYSQWGWGLTDELPPVYAEVGPR